MVKETIMVTLILYIECNRLYTTMHVASTTWKPLCTLTLGHFEVASVLISGVLIRGSSLLIIAFSVDVYYAPIRWWALNRTYKLMSTHLSAVLGDELECGEGLDLDCLHLVLCGVHLGNHHILVLGKMLSKLLPDGSQLLAMAAPWGI